jgi:hypothetical protein
MKTAEEFAAQYTKATGLPISVPDLRIAMLESYKAGLRRAALMAKGEPLELIILAVEGQLKEIPKEQQK